MGTHTMWRFLRDEAGAELVEWAVIAVIALLTTLGVVILIFEEGFPQFFDGLMEDLGFHRVWR